MYNIIFYTNKKGYSEFEEQLEKLHKNIENSKIDRVQYERIILYITLLRQNGNKLHQNIAKHIKDDIWELRPDPNRILYFYYKDGTYVLLHMFRKKTQKTPKEEIVKAIKNCNEYKKRNGDK